MVNTMKIFYLMIEDEACNKGISALFYTWDSEED